MKLYSGPLSLFTAKVRIALAEKSIPYELVAVPFSKRDGYQPKHPDVVRINPKAQVPVVVDGDLEIFDSTLILEYLEDCYPEPPLYPRDLRDKARCRQVEAAADEIFFPHILVLIQEVFYKPDERSRDTTKLATAQAALRQQLAELDRRLVGRTYFFDDFSVADIGYFLDLVFAGNFGIGPTGEANVQRWFANVAARPSVAAELQAFSEWMATH